MITTYAYPRSALIGNPSDHFNGKVISFTFSNFYAEVKLWESPWFEIYSPHADSTRFDSIGDFLSELKLFGYYGSTRIIKAAVKRFHEFCFKKGIELSDKNFSVQVTSNIPRSVGLSGSTAMSIALVRAMEKFYGVKLAPEEVAFIAKSVDNDELGVAAGLQDAVAQSLGGIVYMDFHEDFVDSNEYGHGNYLKLQTAKPLNFYIAYSDARAEVSDVRKRDIKKHYKEGHSDILLAKENWRELVEQAKEAIEAGDHDALHELINEGFNVRRTIMTIAPEHVEMIELARSIGASATFTGSGGAVIGLYHSPAQFNELERKFNSIGCDVVKPQIIDCLGRPLAFAANTIENRSAVGHLTE